MGMRELNKGVQWLQGGKTVRAELVSEFEARLKSMVQEMYDPAVPFRQTEEVKNCSYCPYNRICHRG